MNTIKNILIAVELDDAAAEVIEYGITLSLMLNANVRCLHVYRPEMYRLVYDDHGLLMDNFDDIDEDLDSNSLLDSDKLVEADKEQLVKIVETVKSRMSLEDKKVIVNVRSDFAVSGILSEAEEFDADLIILGGYVGYRMKNMTIGNLAKSIIDKAAQSVIVVPSSIGNRNLDHICMFINFEFEELSMIQDMMDVARNNDTRLSFVHILDKDERVVAADEKLKVYKRLFLNNNSDNLTSFILKSGKFDNIISELTDEMDVDLIGLKAKKKHWNLFGFQKSFDNKVLNRINVPLYIWNE